MLGSFTRVSLFFLLIFLLSPKPATAQRLVAGDTLYGNEWINAGLDYLKLTTTEQGIYRISGAELNAAGWSSFSGDELKLTQFGKEVPLYVSTDDAFAPNDYCLFYLDQDAVAAYEAELYEDGLSGNLNPSARLFSDSVAFYLSRQPGTHQRYTVIDASTTAPATFDTSAWTTRYPLATYDAYSSVTTDQFNGTYSTFDRGEGFSLGRNFRTLFNYAADEVDVAFAPRLVLRAIASDYNTVQRRRRVSFKGNVLLEENASPNTLYNDTLELQSAWLLGTAALGVRYEGLANGADRYAVGLAKLEYRRKLVPHNQSMTWHVRAGSAVQPMQWRQLDPAQEYAFIDVINRQLTLSSGASTVYTQLGVGRSQQRGEMTSLADARTASIRSVDLNFQFSRGIDYLIVSSEKLADWSPNADDYAAFRRMPQHGGYNVLRVNIEDLYEQFGYGTPNDPRAVRNLVAYLKKNAALERVLLLGKGRTFNQTRFPAQLADADNADYYVPSFGEPASDVLLVANGITEALEVSLGRVAAINSSQLSIFMDKMAAEARVRALPQTIEDRFWSKQTIVVGGGKQPDEQNLLKTYLLQLHDELETNLVGAETTGLYKTTTDPIQFDASESYYRRVNEGVSLITFFGHAAATTFDVAIDDFTRYNNKDKYPILVGLGCYSGNANSPGESLGEEFIFTPDKGMGGFLSTIGLSYPGPTTGMLLEVYDHLGGDKFGQPFTDALRPVISNALQGLGVERKQYAQQLIYQGDPAHGIYVHEEPDYIVDESSIRIGPSPLVSSLDSFTVSFEVLNLGRSDTTTFSVEVTRSTPGAANPTVDTVDAVGGIYARRSLSLNVASLYQEGAGLNTLSFRILPRIQQGALPGAVQNDGAASKQFFVASSVAKFIWPVLHATVPLNGLDLYAEFGSPWSEAHVFDLELDKNASFQSPIHRTQVTSKSLIRYPLPAGFSAGETVYARLKLAADTVWTYTDFTLEADEEQYGRAVGEYSQFLAGNTSQLQPRPGGDWQFGQQSVIKVLTNKEFDPNDPPTYEQNLSPPYVSVIPWYTLEAGIVFLIGDSLTGDEIRNSPPQYGSIDLGSPNRAFAYPTSNAAERALAVNFLQTVPQPGEFVWVFTVFRPGFELHVDEWAADTALGYTASLFSVLRSKGAQLLPAFEAAGTVPYTAVYREGEPGLLAEDVGSTRSSVLVTTVGLPLRRRTGIYETPLLTDIDSVYSFSWSLDSARADTSNFADVRLVAVNLDGSTFELSRSTGFSGSLPIAPTITPVLGYRIIIEQRDAFHRRALPIVSLSLLGKERPELVYDPSHAQQLDTSQVLPGEVFDFAIGIRNVSPTTALPFATRVVELGNSDTLATASFGELDQFAATVWRDTISFGRNAGDKSLAFEVEAARTAVERSRVNNLAFFETTVVADEVDPSLRIEVDDILARSKMLVSPTPEITIALTDDYGVDPEISPEQTLALTLTSPTGVTYASNANLLGDLRIVSSAHKERVEYVYEPGRLQHGIWILSVSAVDAYGNTSASPTQRIELEVDTTLAISNVLPYPNPAVDRVFFQYELTGSVPSDYQIDIYTTSGRLVRSLGPAELGDLRIGVGLTSGFWDTTDQYGNKLARGVYLYRFAKGTDGEGESFKTRDSQIDDYIKSGFGKLVLLR